MAGPKAPAVEVEGARELRAALKRFDGRLDDLKDVHADAGELVADAARPLVPVVSGALLDSLRTDRRAAGASVLVGRSTLPYAPPIHFGWRARNIEPQPFLYDALDSRRDEIAARYSAGVGALVTRLDRETPG